MSTEVGRVIGEIEQTRDDIAQIIRDRGSYIAPATKLKDLVPYVRSFAQQELEEGVVTPSVLGIDMYPSEGYVGFSKVTVNPIPYQRKDTDVTVDGATVNIPYGYFRSSVQKSVASGSASTPATTITANPSLATTYTSGSGYKMTVSKTQSVTPTVSAGYVSSGTAGTITVSGSAYVPQSSTGSATASTTDTAKRNIGYGQQTTISAGYYPTDRIVRNSVAAGSAKTPADTITATNTVTIDANGLITATASGSKSITPTVKAGYVSAGTAGTVSVSGTGTLQLSTATLSDPMGAYTSGTNIVIEPSVSKGYTNGIDDYWTYDARTLDSKLVAGNIKKGVSIFGVTGTHEGGASVTTCNVTITIADSVGYVGVTATTFASGAIGTFNQSKSSGTFTINNVVCGSIISVICNGYFSLYSSMASGSVGSSSQYLVAPKTAGNYTAQIIAYDD